MIKNILKYALIFLIFISVLIVPILGVWFGDFDSPSIFDDNVLLTDRQLGGGSSVYLAFTNKMSAAMIQAEV